MRYLLLIVLVCGGCSDDPKSGGDAPCEFECVTEYQCTDAEGVLYGEMTCEVSVLVCCDMPGTDGDSDADTDSDTDTDTDTDADTDTGTDDDCPGWYDSVWHVCWQNPANLPSMNWYEAVGEEDTDHNPGGAIDYCGDLDESGYTDWRLPDIDELLSLMRGCVDADATGGMDFSTCGVTDPMCLDLYSCDEDPECAWCEPLGGPGVTGCYWDPAILDACGYGPIWSSSGLSNSSGSAWVVRFRYGGVSFESKNTWGEVHCVR